MTCTSCGAAAPPGSGSFCSHCGRRIGEASASALPTAMVVVGGTSKLPAASGPAEPPAVDPLALPAPPSEHAARFGAARRDPGFAAAMATEVASPGIGATGMASAGMALFGLVFMVFWMATAPATMKLMGGVFFVVWMAIAGKGVKLVWNRLRAPTEKRLAHVLSRTTRVHTVTDSDGHGPGSSSTRATFEQRVTLELEDGRRLALGGSDAVLGTVVDGDLGVAYVKADQLIGFRRLAG